MSNVLVPTFPVALDSDLPHDHLAFGDGVGAADAVATRRSSFFTSPAIEDERTHTMGCAVVGFLHERARTSKA
eukprot:14921174-Alexandrium_andersonii.AAC.1